MTDQQGTHESIPAKTPMAAIREFVETRFVRSLAVLGAGSGLLLVGGCAKEQNQDPKQAAMAQKSQFTTLTAISRGERMSTEDANRNIQAMDPVIAAYDKASLALVAVQNGLLENGHSKWLFKSEQDMVRNRAIQALDEAAQVSLTASNSPIFTPQFKRAFTDIRTFAMNSRADFAADERDSRWKEANHDIPQAWTRISQVIDALAEANLALRADEGALRPGLQIQELSVHQAEFQQAAASLDLVVQGAKGNGATSWIAGHHDAFATLDTFMIQVQNDSAQLMQSNHLEAGTVNNLVKVNASVAELRKTLGSEQLINDAWQNEQARPQTIQVAETALAAIKAFNADRDTALRTLNPNGTYVGQENQSAERSNGYGYYNHGGHPMIFFYPSYWWNGYGYYGGYYGGGYYGGTRVPSGTYSTTYRSPTPIATTTTTGAGTRTTVPGTGTQTPGAGPRFSGSAGGLSSAPSIPAEPGAVGGVGGPGGEGIGKSPLSASKPGYKAGTPGSASRFSAPRGGFGRTGGFHSSHSWGG